jgi:hypothetical protein
MVTKASEFLEVKERRVQDAGGEKGQNATQ